MLHQNRRSLLIIAGIIVFLAALIVGVHFVSHVQSPAPTPTLEVATPTLLPLPGSISGRISTSDGVTPISEVGILVEGDATQSPEVAITGLDGTYMLDNLPPDTYTITVIILGYETIEKGEITLQSGQKVTNLDFTLRRESSISGKATRADGTPLANVSVLASASGGEKGAAVTAADGTYKVEGLLATGTYQVEAFSEGYGFAPTEATIPNEGDDIVGVDISAFKGVIAGKITKADGITPISGVVVSVQIDASAEALSSPQSIMATATTGEDGAYRLESLQSAAYTLQIFSSGYGIEIRSVQVPDNVNGMEVNVSLKPAGSISGQVTQADGKTPMSGVKINIIDSGNHVVKLPKDIITNQNGEFTIGNLAEGKYIVMADVTASASIIKSDVVVSASQATTSVDLHPDQAGGSISGKVYQADGVTPVKQALIIAVFETAGGSAYTSADGTFVITGLPAGKYSLIVAASGFQTQVQSELSVTSGISTQVNFNLSSK